MLGAPVVSVVMPFYNAGSTLERAVDSILRQRFTDWELLLVDDGSTDDGPVLARSFASQNSRVRVLTLPRTGIVAALQAGCAEAKGEFIARMDADDVSHPERLEKQLALMRDDPKMALCGTGVAMTGRSIGYGRRRYESWINSLTRHEDIVRELFVECPIPHPTFMLRRALFDRMGGYEEHGWAEDYDVCLRVWRAGLRFGKVSEPLLDWTESEKRLSMVSPRYSDGQFRVLKRHYLFESYLAGNRPFVQWGAGEVGKRWLREWRARQPLAVVDISPRKIGTAIHGYRVIAPEELPPGVFVVVAVGALTAREEIREWLYPRRYEECSDFLFLA